MVEAEVLVVLEVEGGQRQVVGESAGGDPHVVGRAGPSALYPGGREPSPGGGAGLVAGQTQSSEQRIALPTPCLHSLEQHHNRQRQDREAAGTGWKDSGYVFTRSD